MAVKKKKKKKIKNEFKTKKPCEKKNHFESYIVLLFGLVDCLES